MVQEHNPTMKDKIIALIIVLLIFVVGIMLLSRLLSYTFSLLRGKEYTTEEIREKIEVYLQEKYGEEFVVDRIGLRSSRGEYFYQARIYPKSIIGTNKEWDDYYYSTASLYKKSFGRLGGVGDGYGKVLMNISAEEYIKPKTKEIFGERVLIKTDIKYKKREESGYFVQYLEENFKEQLEKANNDPENNRLEIDLDIYIFDRIDNEAEKEMRRKQIFDFIQYLKEKGLFEYLEMRIIFVDERALAPSYNMFEREINASKMVNKYIEEENVTVKLPPAELKERMSRELQKEIESMSEEELLAKMRSFRKDELNYNGVGKWNNQYRVLIYSEGMIKERYKSSYQNNPDIIRTYDNMEDVKIGTYLEYFYE